MAPGLRLVEPSLRDRFADAVQAMKGEMRMRGPIVWGESDCILMCADAIRSVTGIDPVAEWRGKWASEDEAYALLNSLGFESVHAAVADAADRMGWWSIHVEKAQAGDLGIVAMGGRQSCAMLHRSGFWIARAPKGYIASPQDNVIAAWSLT